MMTKEMIKQGANEKGSVLPKTKSFWVRAGAGKSYDKEFLSFVGWYVDQSEMRPIESWIKSIKNSKVLDVGCGTGRHLTLFDSSNQLFGLDLSNQMLSEARTKLPKATFVEGSAIGLPFEKESFDVVFSSRVIQHVPDQKAMVREMARVCKTGGVVILLAYNSWSMMCLYKQLRMSSLGRLLNIPFRAILGRRSFLNPWGFDYDNYCSIPEISGWMKSCKIKVFRTHGTGCLPVWFLNDFFVGKILQTLVPSFFKAFLKICLGLDRTLMRHFPFKFFTEKVIVGGIKQPQ